MSDDEINEIPPERVLDRESVLRAKLKEALQDRDEARRERDDALKEWDIAREGWNKALEERDEARKDLVALEELHRRRFGTLRKELAASNRGAKINAHINNSLCSKVIQAERERDEAREELARVQKQLLALRIES